MMLLHCLASATLLVAVCANGDDLDQAADDSPDDSFVVWVSSPTLPNETAVLQTAKQAEDLQLCSGNHCTAVALEQAWARGAKFRVPDAMKLAVWSVRSSAGQQLASINSAEPWWSICNRQPGSSASAATDCVPGASSLRVFGRALAFSGGACVGYKSSLVGAAAAAAITLRLEQDGTAPIELAGKAASCYSAEFELPPSIPPGNYSWSVKNSLDGARYERVLEDLEQRSIMIVSPTVAVAAHTVVVPAGDVAALVAAMHAAKAGATVSLPAGSWKMGALDRLTVPDGVTLAGAGSASTVLSWPTQTGKMCASFKRVNFGGPGE